MTECTIFYRHEHLEPDDVIFTEDIELSIESYRKKAEEIAGTLREEDARMREEKAENTLEEDEEYDGETFNVYDDLEVEIYNCTHTTLKAAEQDDQLLYRLREDRDFMKINGAG